MRCLANRVSGRYVAMFAYLGWREERENHYTFDGQILFRRTDYNIEEVRRSFASSGLHHRDVWTLLAALRSGGQLPAEREHTFALMLAVARRLQEVREANSMRRSPLIS